jgi:hypothetical protein
MQTLELVYFALFVFGAAFAGVGWLVSHGNGRGYAHAHAHGVAVVLNVGVLAGAACAGGAAGLIATTLGAGFVVSACYAIATALIGGAIVAKFFTWLARASTYEEEAHPRIATSLTDFSGTRVGEVIWLCNNGVRRPLPARSDDGSKISRGTEVVVLAVERGIARVAPCSRVFWSSAEPQTSADGEGHRHGYQA